MRWITALAAAALLAAVFVLTAPEPLVTEPTADSLPSPTTPARTSMSVTEGALPDGTGFVVKVEPGVADDWLGTTATIVTDVGGEPTSVGSVDFHIVPHFDYAFDPNRREIPVDGFLVSIVFEQEIMAELGEDSDEIIGDSIKGGLVQGHPVLWLGGPFRWDREQPMAVRFSTFEVRHGCEEMAAVCSEDGLLQVVWRAQELESAPPIQQPEVEIEIAG